MFNDKPYFSQSLLIQLYLSKNKNMNDHHCDYYSQKGLKTCPTESVSRVEEHEIKNNHLIFNNNDDPLWPGLRIAWGGQKQIPETF
jgi:hypothetical protein